MDPVDGDQVYAAERLLQQRTKKGKSEYLVKWKGWSAKHNTWEPVDNILDERLIQEFVDRQPDKSTPKRKSTAQVKEPVAVPAKRGRRCRVAKADSTSDNTSPSTSVGTRRSSRSVASVSEQQKQVQQSEDSEASEKPAQETSEDSDTPADCGGEDDGESEVETVKKREAAKDQVVESAPKAENDKEVVCNAESTPKLFESSAEDSCLSDEAVDSSEETAKDNVGVEASNQEAQSNDHPVEIHVERSERNASDDQASENGASNADPNQEKYSYVIANEEDANCTHKIQVFTVPSTSTPAKEQSQANVSAVEKKATEGGSNADDEEQEERFEIVKDNTFATGSTNGNGGGSTFLDTVGDDRSSNNEQQQPPQEASTIPQQTKNASETTSETTTTPLCSE